MRSWPTTATTPTMTLVTLFTDASWCSQTQIGAWAAWWKAGRLALSERASGVLRQPMPSSMLAEACGLVNALAIVARAYPGARIIAQNDSLDALRLLMQRPRKPGKHPMRLVVWEEAMRVIECGRLSVETRHVRAHTGRLDPRSKVNDWCDREAKRLMRAARQAAIE